MSAEHNSTSSHLQGKHSVSRQHEEMVVRHAVRNIKNADKLCDELFQKHRTFTKRLADKPKIEGFQHHLG